MIIQDGEIVSEDSKLFIRDDWIRVCDDLEGIQPALIYLSLWRTTYIHILIDLSY